MGTREISLKTQEIFFRKVAYSRCDMPSEMFEIQYSSVGRKENIYQNTRRHISDEHNLNTRRREYSKPQSNSVFVEMSDFSLTVRIICRLKQK
jgi:hypothetical protein